MSHKIKLYIVVLLIIISNTYNVYAEDKELQIAIQEHENDIYIDAYTCIKDVLSYSIIQASRTMPLFSDANENTYNIGKPFRANKSDVYPENGIYREITISGVIMFTDFSSLEYKCTVLRRTIIIDGKAVSSYINKINGIKLSTIYRIILLNMDGIDINL